MKSNPHHSVTLKHTDTKPLKFLKTVMLIISIVLSIVAHIQICYNITIMYSEGLQ